MTVAYFGSGATLGVFIDFDAGVTDTPAAWVDVTGDVVIDQPLTINRGRSSERDTFQTGTLNLTLLNTARKYDPEHSAGAYFGKLLPGRPIKVELTYSGSTSVLFRGFIQGWPQSWEMSDNKSVVTITAFDAFKYLALARLPESRYVAEVLADSPLAWWRLGESEGTIANDSSGNNRPGLYVNGPTFNSRAGLVAFQPDTALAFDADSRQYVDTRYKLPGGVSIEFWFQSEATTETTRAIFGAKDNPAADYGVGGVMLTISVPDTGAAAGKFLVEMNGPGASSTCRSTSDAATGVTKHVVVATRNGAAPAIYVNGVDESAGQAAVSGVSFSNLPEVTVGAVRNWGGYYLTGTLDEVAIYSGDLGVTRALAHYNAGTTANAGDDVDAKITQALTDAGITWLATSLEDSLVTTKGAEYGTSVLAYLQSLERTEQGRVFIAADGTLTFHANTHDASASVAAAFTDVAGGSLPYVECEHEFDDTRIINDAIATRQGGVAQRYSDATSEAKYGLRSASVDGLQGETDANASAIASYLVNRYKDPAARIRALSVKPRANAAGLFPVVRTLDIGSKVTVRRLPLGTGSAFTKTLMIEGVTHSIGIDGEWVTTYLTSPADASGVALWDSGLWDQEKWGI